LADIIFIYQERTMKIRTSEITPEHVYLTRRDFMKATGILGGTAAFLAACAGTGSSNLSLTPRPLSSPVAGSTTDELGNSLTEYEAITHYNNYYEFSIDKDAPARLSSGFSTSPWQIEVGGMVRNPKTYDVNALVKKFVQEERIYRLRCVEAWSMVIPWIGFSLKQLLDEVEPASDARYVRFETILDRDQMPGQKSPWYHWPYIEGLTIEEAYNDLVILATGIYGNPLLPQNGAPVRLVVPWKYGFKSIKSIVKIDLVSEMPVSLWMAAAPNEYGFYANVNPNVNHPRWSQASERRIGDLGRIPTLMFNGYEDEVASLYTGMDLKANY
jgi:methionine sulfoxide reductase catalytic subunit